MYAGVYGVTAYNILSMFGVENHAQTSGQGIQQGNEIKTSSCRVDLSWELTWPKGKLDATSKPVL
jgi:hypothetical protein